MSERYYYGSFSNGIAFMREYLIKLKPNTLEDIIAMIALYRPAFRMKMVDIISTGKWIEKLITLKIKIWEIKKYLWVIVYQEQVTTQEFSEFTLGQGYLRKAMGKKILSNGGQRQALLTVQKNQKISRYEDLWSNWNFVGMDLINLILLLMLNFLSDCMA